VRRYDAWYRHITLALLAHAYLEITRLSALVPPRPEAQAAVQNLLDGKGGDAAKT
jgi:hypothetical protein